MLSFGNKEFRNLQEQVLKNAQDIETLKGRENLQIVIVEELPEEGNPNYIYLVPNEEEEESNVYNEYIWLADEEAYEKIGGVSIDLTNYVTTNTEQTITAVKNLSANVIPSTDGSSTLGATNKRFATLHVQTIRNDYGSLAIYSNGNMNISFSGTEKSLTSTRNQTDSLGSSTQNWKNLYLSGNIDFGNNAIIKKDTSNRVVVQFGGNDKVKVGDTVTYFDTDVTPVSSNTNDLGSNTYCWKDVYIAGNISDGTNSVTVANISTKVTSTQASGTFDSNGSSTFLVADGTLTGLFVFAYGNCQCMFQLTETMVQNANVTPIRVAIPMMYNSAAVNGWLEISRSVYAFTFTITDGTNHVDSGYAWTLTKTNLL